MARCKSNGPSTINLTDQIVNQINKVKFESEWLYSPFICFDKELSKTHFHMLSCINIFLFEFVLTFKFGSFRFIYLFADSFQMKRKANNNS